MKTYKKWKIKFAILASGTLLSGLSFLPNLGCQLTENWI
jgi:hypothetical protein